jgi:hypothetical protein
MQQYCRPVPDRSALGKVFTFQGSVMRSNSAVLWRNGPEMNFTRYMIFPIYDRWMICISPIRNLRRLAEAIEKIINNIACSYPKRGNAARQRVVELFDQNKVVDQ